jgi:hypothetical protein
MTQPNLPGAPKELEDAKQYIGLSNPAWARVVLELMAEDQAHGQP